MNDVHADSWDPWNLSFCGTSFGDERDVAFRTRCQHAAANLELSPWDLTIFESIHYDIGQVETKELLASCAFGRYWKSHPQDVQHAIDNCFSRGWIDFLSLEFLQNMQEELDQLGFLQPSGLIGRPQSHLTDLAGLISITRQGAERDRAFSHATHDGDIGHWVLQCDTDTPDSAGMAFGTSVEECEYACRHVYLDIAAEYGDPIPIGRWCDRWWRRFESGYTMRFWRGVPGHDTP